MNTIMENIAVWGSQIDWSATGSMLGAIGTCIAAVIALWIAIKQNKITKQIADEQNRIEKEIAEKQLRQAELDQKIALYDKRFECYLLFNKFLYIGSWFSKLQKPLTEDLERQFINQIYYGNDSERDALAKQVGNIAKDLLSPTTSAIAQIQNFAGLKTPIGDKYIADEKLLEQMHLRLKNLDFDYAESQISKIKMSEFCFPTEISEIMIQYISLIFSYDAYENKKLDNDKIIEVYKEICNKQIVPRIKSYLNLASDEVGANK